MIPTSVSNSPSSTATAVNANSNVSQQQSVSSAMIGIASLILEGRAIAEDEYYQPHVGRQATPEACAGIEGGPSASGSIMTPPRQQSPKPGTSKASPLASGSSTSGGISSGSSCTSSSSGRISGISSYGHPINITTNPTHNLLGHFLGGGGIAGSSYGLQTSASLVAGGSSSSSGALASSGSATSSSSSAAATHQRWTQKLSQLRQASPAASFSPAYEQRVMSEVPSTSRSGDMELNDVDIVDLEFNVNRPELLGHSTSGSAVVVSSGAEADNHLHSLLTLTASYLREEPSAYHFSSLASSPSVSPKYNFPSTSSAAATMNKNPWLASSANNNASQAISATVEPTTNVAKDVFLRQSSGRIPIPNTATKHGTPFLSLASTPRTATATATTTKNSSSSKYPTQGPHCDQYLRKMGLAKGEAAEAEDHICDMSYVNITCSRWRAYCLKMEAIIEQGEAVCIEVYLGPVGHKILLEQWIIMRKEKVPPPTMTLPSLCSAIRSQLYFSQISAWCDLIKKSDKSIYDTGRIIYPTPTGAAGDLATTAATANSPNASAATASVATANAATPNSSPNSSTSASPLMQLASAMLNRRPRLNIYYRVKKYDSMACFNSKPNVHNFPNVNISENCSISVCLKSLPRINGGIPKICGTSTISNTLHTTATAVPTTATYPAKEINSQQLQTQRDRKHPEQERHQPMDTSQSLMMEVVVSRPLSSTNDSHNGQCVSTMTPKEALGAPPQLTTSYNGGPTAAPLMSASGKHKCTFFIDEEELNGGRLAVSAPVNNGPDDDGTNDDGSNSSNGNLSHREKQLAKYRKRMQKRDKKTRSQASNSLVDALSETRSNSGDAEGNGCQPMEEGEDDSRSSFSQSSMTNGACGASAGVNVEMISTGTQTQMTCCQQCGNEKAFVCLKCMDDRKPPVEEDVESTCSLSSSEIIHTPRNPGELLLLSIQRTAKVAKQRKSCNSSSTFDRGSMSSTNSAPSKLQNNNHVNAAMISSSNMGNAGCQVCKRQKTQHDFSPKSNAMEENECVAENAVEAPVAAEVKEATKTETNEEDSDTDGGKIPAPKEGQDECDKPAMEEAKVDVQKEQQKPKSEAQKVKEEQKKKAQDSDEDVEGCEELISETFVTTTKFTPNIRLLTTCIGLRTNNNNSSSNNKNTAPRSCTPPSAEYNIAMTKQFRTPTNGQHIPAPMSAGRASADSGAKSKVVEHKLTPKPGLLIIPNGVGPTAAVGGGGLPHAKTAPSLVHDTTPKAQSSSMAMRKNGPKVNLTPIFLNSPCLNEAACVSAPIAINVGGGDGALGAGDNCFSFDTATISNQFKANPPPSLTLEGASIPVQKSNSAPTLPNSPSLSPRFAKQAAIYKRRSRHLSDRSDRSSLGSDEQFSDEELLECTGQLYSPATSPMKARTRSMNAFGKQTLVGNLEESLLQRRLRPKIEVVGFKVLLGASGGFCPTQLTIPAVAYFYELPGETLSTPYVCEVRLSRKGYSVPRAGTVQVTLLNPMGTVVRMFVIPYDMRDMPPLHQTFIRQRVLAEAATKEPSISPTNSNSSNNNNNYNKYRLSPNGGLHSESNLGHFISVENMKRLRYSIHLRFQTSRSGRLTLHTDIRILVSRRTDCDTAAAHAKGVLETPNDVVTDTVMPSNPKYSARQDNSNNKI